MITPARRRTLHEEISDQIIDLITDGSWPPGEKIPGELALSEQFQVSRNSLRESIKALELVGLLSSHPGKGTFVSSLAVERIHQLRYHDAVDGCDSILDLMEVRLLIEPSLCYTAAEQATAEQLEALEAAVNKISEAVRKNEYNFEHHMDFHMLLYRISGNPLITGFLDSIRERLIIARRDIYFKVESPEIVRNELDEHEKILEAIKSGDGKSAFMVMREHLSAPIERYRKVLE